MRIRPSIFIFCTVIALLAVMLVWNYKRSTPISAKTATPPQTVGDATIMPSPQKIKEAATSSQITVSTSTNPTNIIRKNKAQQMLEGLSTLNDIPITFYGKIEDQFSNAVANTTVTFGVRVYNGYESTVKSGQTVSDANGLFTITGYKGESLGLGVKKEGYAFVSINGSVIYSKLYPEEQRAHPDPNNPTVIKMWKLQGVEPLLDVNKEYKLHYTEKPINFDLVAGEIVPTGGDLKIMVNRPEGTISGRNPQDWSINVGVVDGGFIETSQEAAATAYAAPESGYQSSGTFEKNNGPTLVDKMLFIQSRNGQAFSKIHLLFGINGAPDGFMNVTFTGVMNTNGSRNWEATAPQ